MGEVQWGWPIICHTFLKKLRKFFTPGPHWLTGHLFWGRPAKPLLGPPDLLSSNACRWHTEPGQVHSLAKAQLGWGKRWKTWFVSTHPKPNIWNPGKITGNPLEFQTKKHANFVTILAMMFPGLCKVQMEPGLGHGLTLLMRVKPQPSWCISSMTQCFFASIHRKRTPCEHLLENH